MKLPNLFRHRRRNTVLLFVGIAASCLIYLAWRDNPSSASFQSQKRQPTIVKASVVKAPDVSHFEIVKRREIIKVTPTEGHHGGTTKTVEPTTAKKHVQRLSFVRRNYSVKPKWNKQLYYNKESEPEQFRQWRKRSQPMCDREIIGYENEFLEARNMIIDRNNCICELQGGELIENVINQAEAAEYYQYEMGCFKAACSRRPSYYFNGENHLTKWLYSLATQNVMETADHIINEFTIAITRYEYANLFHTMTDWYNAFLVMQFFNHTSYNTNILIIDAHPYGALDSVWTQLFNSTVRLAGLPRKTQFKHLVWGIMGYNSLMKINVAPNPPLYEDFRNFFLSAYDINTDRQIDCKKLSILFIWRHDYVAHPRNPSGFVSRKIKNEEQLIRYVKRRNSNAVVKGMQIDMYSMRQQLQFIADADILVGMHGAGLTHAVFMQKNTALIELVPNYWSPMAEHFKAICVWRNLSYQQWFNNDPRNEFPDQSTNIPPQVMNTLIKNTIRDMCGHRDNQ